jgi:hypothetical protein
LGWFIPTGGIELARAVLSLSQAVEPDVWTTPPIAAAEAAIWEMLGRERFPEVIGTDLYLERQRRGCETVEGSALRWRVYSEAAYTMRQALAASRTIAFALDQEGHAKIVPGHMWATDNGVDWLGTGLIHLLPKDDLAPYYETPIFMLQSGIDAAISFARGGEAPKRISTTNPQPVGPQPASHETEAIALVARGQKSVPRSRGRPAYDWRPAKELVFRLLEEHGLPMKANPELPSQAALCAKVSDLMSDILDGEQVGKTTVEDRVRDWIMEWRGTAPG